MRHRAGIVGWIRPFARREWGDGVEGSGSEVALGARLDAPERRVRLEAAVHAVAAHTEDDYRECGANVIAAYLPRPDGTGLRVSMALRRGAPGETSRLGESWRLSSGLRDAQRGMRGDVSVGFGFRTLRGLVRPFAGVGKSDRGRSIAPGLRYEALGGRPGFAGEFTIGHRRGGGRGGFVMARFENPAVRNRERNMSGAVAAVPGKSRPGDRGAAVGWSMRRMFARMVLGLFGTFAWAAESEHTVPYVPSAAAEVHAGVVRIESRSASPGEVRVLAVDDAGRAGGPVTVELAAWEARGYTASELESGTSAGLSGSLGDGSGKWRLRLSAERGSAYATHLLEDGSLLSSVPGGMSRGARRLHRVALFPSASDGAGRRGVVRVVNRSAEPAEVSIEAFDSTDRSYEEVRLRLGAGSSSEFDSSDLEQGDAEKDLTGSTGPGEGDWWLELSSASDIAVLSYVDTASGPLSALRGTSGVETETGMRYEAVLLGGSSALRLLNADADTVEVRLTGTDDAGAVGGVVELTVEPWSVRTLTREALAEGEAGLRGALGSGTGSWRLRLEADGEIDVLSLVRGAGGMLSDVSRRGRPAGAPPRTEVVDATASSADLWVRASASARALSPGEAFELTATVGNRGRAVAPATTLRYRRSADAAITASDTEVGADAVAALGPAGSSAASLTLNAPSEPGTHYYGACVDAVAEETNTANNCSAAVAVAVAVAVEARPDLVVTVDALDGTVEPAERFTLRATVRNAGVGAASATTLRYYSSSDNTISTTDTQLGTDPVAALGPAGSSAASLTLYAPTAPGTYHYGACVDAVAEETNTANNCSAAVAVAVEARPDLVVTVDALDGMVEPAERFTLRATVRNAGVGAASATTLRYYSSSDNTISTTDTQLGTDPVAALGPAGSSAASLTLYAPTAPGTYHYGACVDAVPDESNVRNNCSAAVGVEVAQSATYYGAVTARNGYRRRACSSFWGLVTDRESELEAKRLAAEACREKVPEDDGPPHLTCPGEGDFVPPLCGRGYRVLRHAGCDPGLSQLAGDRRISECSRGGLR